VSISEAPIEQIDAARLLAQRTRDSIDAQQAAVRLVKCPKCGSNQGSYCIGSDVLLDYSHRERVMQFRAREAWSV
jgi:hypothetical protein